MPYAIAHPVAVIPLSRALGRRAVPSALVIGSVIPDAWYLVPGLDRPFSHDASGLFLFCLPLGLLAYALYHVLLKEPLLQLFPSQIAGKLRSFTTSFRKDFWVLPSLLAGAITHLAWDGFTHAGRLSRAFPEVLTETVLRVLQHGSTLLGTLFLIWWCWRKLGEVRPVPFAVLGARSRYLILGVLATSALAAAAWAFPESYHDIRRALRASAVGAVGVLGAGLLAYAVLFRCMRRNVSVVNEATPSAPVTQSESAPKRDSSTSKRNGAEA